MNPSGVIMTVTPPAMAMRQRPARICSQAMWTAVRADEQAVSIDMLGPRRFRQYEMRLAAMLWALPVGECGLMPARSVAPPWMFW